eukprot:1976254-Alexandrium_andersonii.AAC.1
MFVSAPKRHIHFGLVERRIVGESLYANGATRGDDRQWNAATDKFELLIEQFNKTTCKKPALKVAESDDDNDDDSKPKKSGNGSSSKSSGAGGSGDGDVQKELAEHLA